MNISDLKIGSKITLTGNREFRVIDIVKENDKDYMFCCTNKPPILPIVFEYKIEGEKLKVRQEKNRETLKVIFAKVVAENS